MDNNTKDKKGDFISEIITNNIALLVTATVLRRIAKNTLLWYLVVSSGIMILISMIATLIFFFINISTNTINGDNEE